jgi:peptide/nickel transport system substrate-binding protein
MNAILRRTSIVALSLGLGAGCLSSFASAETVVRVAMTAGDIPDWSGQTDQGGEGLRFVGFTLHDSLVNWDLSRGDVEAPPRPALATKWYVDPNNKTRWIFELRRDVKFHDGCTFNADAVVWNINRLIDSKAPGYDPIHYARARPRTATMERVEKIDEYTAAVYAKTVDSFFIYNMIGTMMISPCAVEKAGFDYKVYAKAPAGTGPYKFDKVVPHERLELVRNPDYWDKTRIPKHDRLVLIPMPEATTRAAALLAGQVDFIEAPSPDTIDRLKAAGMTVITHPYQHDWDYLMNSQTGPFKDLRVRQAANYAIDRDEMVALLNGTAIPSNGFFTATSKYYGKPVEYKYDPAKATALLKAANCYPCKVNIVMSTAGSGQMQPLPMNALVKSQLDAVGFDVNFAVIDWNALSALRREPWQKNPTYNGLNYSTNSTEPEAGLLKEVMTRFRVPEGTNWGWYENAEIDKLGTEVMQTFDDEGQTKLLRRMHEIVVEDAARIFIVHDLNPRALSPKLKGFVQAQSWYQDLTPIVVEP